MMNNRMLDVIVFLGAVTNAQRDETFRPAPGQTASNACRMPANGKCNKDGSDNWVSRDLQYDKETGRFVGSITSNRCQHQPYGWNDPDFTSVVHDAECIHQPFPAPGYGGGRPKGAPLRGPIAYSMHGLDIYGPFEGGFVNGQASCDLGWCPGGLDIPTCEEMLRVFCNDDVEDRMLSDKCGGHAKPYHYHSDMPCDYDTHAKGHSGIVGIGLDGVGIYGMYENENELPTDLDACGGHFGPTPGSDEYGLEASENVYHYHLQGEAPYTLGCFGPVESQQHCMDLYDECSETFEVVLGPVASGLYDEEGKRCYNADCPCFDGEGKNTEYSVADCPDDGSTEFDTPNNPKTPEPTADPTPAPTQVPTAEPTPAPTQEPTAVPTSEVVTLPTPEPTAAPTRRGRPSRPNRPGRRLEAGLNSLVNRLFH